SFLIVLVSFIPLANAGVIGDACLSDIECSGTVAHSYCNQAFKTCACCAGYIDDGSGSATACGITYVCKRAGSGCDVTGGTCDITSGTCTCNQGYEGFNCAVQTVSKAVALTDCTPTCDSKGTLACANDGSGNKCYCDYGYYDDDCSQARVEAKCEATTMQIMVNPYTPSGVLGDFKGDIYINGFNTPACAFDIANTPVGKEGKATLPLTLGDANCFNPAWTLANTPSAGDTTYEADVHIQYNPLYQTQFDETYQVQCVYKQDGSVLSSIDVNFNPVSNLPSGGGFQQWFNPITFNLLNASDVILDEPQAVGAVVKLKFSMTANTKYLDFRVDDCTLQNQPFAETYSTTPLSKKLITSGCADSDAGDVIVPDPFDKTGNDITFAFKVFQFNDVSDLFIQCSLTLCETTAACTSSSCNKFYGTASGGSGAVTAPGYGRKRRQTTSTQKETTMTQRIRITPKISGENSVLNSLNGPTTVNKQETPKMVSCMESLTFASVVGILSLLLLVAIGTVIFTCYKSREMAAQKEKIVAMHSKRQDTNKAYY
ncbi:unnamed protein product, partial [Owenia fusiformis]